MTERAKLAKKLAKLTVYRSYQFRHLDAARMRNVIRIRDMNEDKFAQEVITRAANLIALLSARMRNDNCGDFLKLFRALCDLIPSLDSVIVI